MVGSTTFVMVCCAISARVSPPKRRLPLTPRQPARTSAGGRSAACDGIVIGDSSLMIVALASPRVASTIDDGLDKIKRLLSAAAAQGAEIVCFPEAYIPGLRGQDFEVPPFDQTEEERALKAVAQWARTDAVAAILGMVRLTQAGRQIATYVIDAQGRIQGYQTKNQLDPTEDQFYVPGNTRRLFEINGVKFGVAICHEGW